MTMGKPAPQFTSVFSVQCSKIYFVAAAIAMSSCGQPEYINEHTETQLAPVGQTVQINPLNLLEKMRVAIKFPKFIPSTQAPTAPVTKDFLLDEGNVFVSFDCAKGHPNWVSWTLSASDFGSAKRTKDFHSEQKLPTENCINPKPSDYSGSGYDRGHMAPSADRTKNKDTNRAVFSMANIVPQSPQVNQKGWNDLENLTRDMVRSGEKEAIIVSGAWGSIGTLDTNTPSATEQLTGVPAAVSDFIPAKVNIPAKTWKIVLVIPTNAKALSESTTKVLAVMYDNDKELPTVPLRDTFVSVDTIEKTIGYDLLSGIVDTLEKRLEEKITSLQP